MTNISPLYVSDEYLDGILRQQASASFDFQVDQLVESILERGYSVTDSKEASEAVRNRIKHLCCTSPEFAERYKARMRQLGKQYTEKLKQARLENAGNEQQNNGNEKPNDE
jgi:hypothetical protein